MKKIMILISTLFMLPVWGWAAASLGDALQLMQDQCMSCHDAELDPPMGPPMFAVQMRYKIVYADRAAFVEAITRFVMHPEASNAVLQNAVEMLGVMPDIEVDESGMRNIAAYIYDADFAPPCAHWQASMTRAKAAGDMQHYQKDQMMYQRMCVK